MVEAVREELRKKVLIKSGELRIRVNQQLQRDDVTPANIRVAVGQIPCTVIRGTVLREIAQGAFHPKEEVVFAEVFSVFEQGAVRENRVPVSSFSLRALPVHATKEDVVVINTGDGYERGEEFSDAESERRVVSHEECGHSEKRLRDAERVSAAGIEAIREEPDEAVIQKTQADFVGKLLSPHVGFSDIPESVVRMVKAMTMYHSGARVSQIGRWFGGKAKRTLSTWIMGFSLALWPVIRGGVGSHVKGTRVSIDEKWLKIRKKWYSWFVAVDQDRDLPFFRDLLPTRRKWACRVLLL